MYVSAILLQLADTMDVKTFHFLVFVRQPHLSPRLSSDIYILSLDEEVIDVPGSYGLWVVTGHIPIMSRHAWTGHTVCMHVILVCFVCRQAVWLQEKSLFPPGSAKDISHEGDSYKAGTTACC